MSIQDTEWGFPDKNRPDKEKDSKYVCQALRAIWRSGGARNYYGRPGPDAYAFDAINPGERTSGEAQTIYGDWRDVQRNYDFMKALLGAREYIAVHSGDSVDANNTLQQRGIAAVLPKDYVPLVNHLLNKLSSRPTDLIGTVIDPDSNSAAAMEKYMAKARIRSKNDPRMQALMQDAGIDSKLPADHPQDEEEWGTWEWKSKVAMDAELIVLSALNLNSYEDLVQPRAAEDLLATGMICGTVVLNNRGMPKIVVRRRTECILPYTADSYRTPMPWGGIVRFMTVEDIMGEAGAQISKERYAEMRKAKPGMPDRSFGVFPNPNVGNQTSARFTVVTGWFIDVNHMDRVVEEGYKRPAKEGEEPTYQVPYQVVYQGNLVIDTLLDSGTGNDKGSKDIHWGCGLAYNMERQQELPYETRIPLFAVPVAMENMRIKPYMSIIQEHFHAVVKAFLEIENLLNNVMPPGFILSPDSLVGISGPDGKPAQMTDVIKTRRNTGVLVVQTMSVVDPNNADMPRQVLPVEVDPGMVPDFTRLVELYEWKLRKLADILTIPPATLGQIEERDAVRNIQQQMAVGNSAHKHLTDALDRWKEGISERCYNQVQNALKAGVNYKGYALLHGDKIPRQVVLTAGTDLKALGIKVEERLTTEDRRAIVSELMAAKSVNKLTEAQYLKLLFAPNLKKMVSIMEKEIAANEEKAHKRQMELVAQQSQGNQMAAQVQADAMLQKVQSEGQANAELVNLKGQMQLQDTQLKEGGQMERLVLTMQAELQKMSMQLAESNDATMRKIEAMLQKTVMDNDTKREIAEEVAETQVEVASKRKPPGGGET